MYRTQTQIQTVLEFGFDTKVDWMVYFLSLGLYLTTLFSSYIKGVSVPVPWEQNPKERKPTWKIISERFSIGWGV